MLKKRRGNAIARDLTFPTWDYQDSLTNTYYLVRRVIQIDKRRPPVAPSLRTPKITKENFFFFHYKHGEKNENTHTAPNHIFPSENSLTFFPPKQSNTHLTTEIINKRLSPMACSSAALRTISSASVKLANSTSPTKSSSILVPFKLNNPFLITQCPHLQAATSCNFTVPKRSFTCRSQANSSDDPRPS